MFTKLPPVPAWSSALVAALIGFGGTVALVVQAMRTLGAGVEQTGSALTALCLGIALAGGLLSLRLRLPVILAWSTPGAALLAAAAPGTLWPEAVGAFLLSGALMVLIGLVPALNRLALKIPASVASAMLAGVLLPFCLGLFRVAGTSPLLVSMLLGVYLVARLRAPLYALLLVLMAGLLFTLARGEMGALPPGATFGVLAFTTPHFTPGALVAIGLPLFLVTLVSQNLPGLVVLRTAGYSPEPRPLLVGTGFASLLMAPFGAHAVNLAAITAAICTSDEAHPDRQKRWVVGLLYAGFYLALAAFAPAFVRFFMALPNAVIAALTGIALVPALTGAIAAMLKAEDERDAAILTFLATGSGLALFGLGSAFWGLVAGFAALGARAIIGRRG